MKWKVIEQRGGTVAFIANIPSNWNRPGSDERLLWEGEASDNSDALHLAQAAGVPLELGPYGFRLKEARENR